MRTQPDRPFLFVILCGCIAWSTAIDALAAGQTEGTSRGAGKAEVQTDASIFSPSLKKLGTLTAGTSVEVLQEITDRNGEQWLKVESEFGVGYVRTSKTDYKHRPATTSPADSAAFALPAHPDAVLDAGLKLIHSLSRSAPGDNAAVSPYGLWSNARLWLAGAQGSTRQRLVERLGFDGKSTRSVSSAAFVSADKILKRPEIDLQPQFAQFAQDARVSIVDSVFDDQARTNLNTWIEDRSRGQITNFYGRDQWDSDAQLILLNVCTLDAKWKDPFDDRQTADAPFYGPDGQSHTVRMMIQQTELPWISTPDFNGVVLPYQQADLAAVILLPSEQNNLTQLCTTLDGAQFSKVVNRATVETVVLLLPRFQVSSRLNLLEALDLQTALNEESDFSGITTTRVEISSVQQQVSLTVDSEGTTAAAATATQLGTSSVGESKPRLLECNRPFLLMVVHRPTLTPLFATAVRHPSTP